MLLCCVGSFSAQAPCGHWDEQWEETNYNPCSYQILSLMLCIPCSAAGGCGHIKCAPCNSLPFLLEKKEAFAARAEPRERSSQTVRADPGAMCEGCKVPAFNESISSELRRLRESQGCVSVSVTLQQMRSWVLDSDCSK